MEILDYPEKYVEMDDNYGPYLFTPVLTEKAAATYQIQEVSYNKTQFPRFRYELVGYSRVAKKYVYRFYSIEGL